MLDDIIFYTTLISAICLGNYYKKIENLEMRKNYGVGLGLIMALLICGKQIYHGLLLVWGNCVLLKSCSKSYVHIVSLLWTWMYMLFIHLNIKDAVYVSWLYQNMALRLVGLAFELHDETLNANTVPKPHTSAGLLLPRKKSTKENTNAEMEPSVIDIVSYSFFFIGLHKGPYYKWKIYNDHLKSSFGDLGDCRTVTEQKLKKALILFTGYVLLRMNFSPYMYYDENFYKYYDPDTRYLYNIPILGMYYLKSQIIMLLCTSVCTEAGFGVYPAKTQPLPGLGPSTRLSLLKLVESPETAIGLEFNFSMLKCFDTEKIIIGPTMSDTVRGWNMSTRYWFWANIYRGTVKANRDIRATLSFLAWAIWSGPSMQHIIIGSTIWIYCHLETEYMGHFEAGNMEMPWNFGFSIMRMFCLIYLTPCFAVSDTATVFKYYGSIFWIYHIILILLIIGAIVLNKIKQRTSLHY